jgi:hypothetical protein
MLAVIYRVPWGGSSVDLDTAGSVAEWTTNLFTGLGIIGLLYQVGELRRIRNGEDFRELNALMVHSTSRPWNLDGKEPGMLYSVWVVNHGDRKCMDLGLEFQMLGGEPMPSHWIIAEPSGMVVVPPAAPLTSRWAIHVPQADITRAVGDREVPTFLATWTDGRSRKVQMRDNDVASVR